MSLHNEAPHHTRQLVVEGPAQFSSKEASEEISLIDLVSVLIRHRRLIIIISTLAFLIGAAAAYAYRIFPHSTAFMADNYEASALVMVENSTGGLSSSLSSSGLGSLAGLAGIPSGSRNNGSLAIRLAATNSFIDAVALHFNLAENKFTNAASPVHAARSYIVSGLSLTQDTNTGILSIRFTDSDPQFAADIANYAADNLALQFRTMDSDSHSRKQTLLESKLTEVQNELLRLEAAVQDFQRNNGVLTMESVVAEQLSTLGRIRSELILKEIEIKTHTDLVTVEDPQLRQMRAERNNLAAMLEEMEEGYNEYASFLPVQKDIPALALEYARLKRSLQVQEELFRNLMIQYETGRLVQGSESEALKVLEYAEAPMRPSGPNRKMVVIVAVMGGFFLGVFLAFFLEYVKRIQKEPGEMKKLISAWKGDAE